MILYAARPDEAPREGPQKVVARSPGDIDDSLAMDGSRKTDDLARIKTSGDHIVGTTNRSARGRRGRLPTWPDATRASVLQATTDRQVSSSEAAELAPR
jgi:hypothetical protein